MVPKCSVIITSALLATFSNIAATFLVSSKGTSHLGKQVFFHAEAARFSPVQMFPWDIISNGMARKDPFLDHEKPLVAVLTAQFAQLRRKV